MSVDFKSYFWVWQHIMDKCQATVGVCGGAGIKG